MGRKIQPTASNYWRKIVSQPQIGKGSKPIRRFTSCYKWTSRKKETLSQWVEPSETKPHTTGWTVQIMYRLCNNRCYTTIESYRTCTTTQQNTVISYAQMLYYLYYYTAEHSRIICTNVVLLVLLHSRTRSYHTHKCPQCDTYDCFQ